jgi:hypothetical protein
MDLSRRPRSRDAAILLIGLALLVAAIAPRRSEPRPEPARLPTLPTPLQAPRRATPIEAFRRDVDRAALRMSLECLQPISPKETMASCLVALHALRLWGPAAKLWTSKPSREKFDFLATLFAPSDLLAMLLDDDAFERIYPAGFPLLIPTPHGVTVRAAAMSTSNELPLNVWPDYEPHVDKLLSVLGETGIRLDHPTRWRDQSPAKHDGTVADLLRESLRRFSYSQELEFSARAYLYYLSAPMTWTTRFGELASIEQVLELLSGRSPVERCCEGIHKYMVLALALNLDGADPWLTPASRRMLTTRLRAISDLLEANQEEDGSWPIAWSVPKWPVPKGRLGLKAASPAPLAELLRVAGHHLDWIAPAPAEARPSDACVRRAIAYTQRALPRVAGEDFLNSYAALSHAARALVLLSGVDPQALADGPKATGGR